MAEPVAITSKQRQQVQEVEPKRMTITTNYMRGRNHNVVFTTRAYHANSAVLNCVKHMQLNHYEADVAEVYDTKTGELHAVVAYKPGIGKIEIVYKREVKEGM